MNVTGKSIRIRDRISSDYADEAVWQADKEILQYDPPTGKLFNNQLFSIETLDGIHIGTCSLYNNDSTRVQLGIRIGDKSYWDKGYGTEVINLLVSYAFASLGVERVWLKVLPQNIRAIRCYEKCGFAYCGRLALDGYDFVMMERRCEWRTLSGKKEER